jgi:hypothetical protein
MFRSTASEAVLPRFLVVYNSPVSARQQMAAATPEQAKAGMEAWIAWAQKAGGAVIDLGTPLQAAARLRRRRRGRRQPGRRLLDPAGRLEG